MLQGKEENTVRSEKRNVGNELCRSLTQKFELPEDQDNVPQLSKAPKKKLIRDDEPSIETLPMERKKIRKWSR